MSSNFSWSRFKRISVSTNSANMRMFILLLNKLVDDDDDDDDKRSSAFFSAITFGKDMPERCKHLKDAQFDDTDRLVCSMTFSGQVMTLTFGQIFIRLFKGKI